MEQRDFLRKQMLKKTREQIEEKFAGKEIHIIKAVNLLMDLDSINNLMTENLNEWKIRSPSGEALNEFGALETNTKSIEEEKAKLTEFIEKEMREEFPNFSELATPIIGAKLLSEAGSKKRLAFMPASTIQVLGAEKALFAHLRKNAKSPKHGHLFNHPLLQNMPRYKRGKAARIIAGKLAIALKQDYFGGENTSKEVKKELEEKISELMNEPETEEQRQKEMEYEQINAQRRQDEFAKENRKRENQSEHRTFTPEERKAFFLKNGMNKPFERKEGQEDTYRERREFAPRREGAFRERREGFGERREYRPRREGFGGERGFERRERRPFRSSEGRSFGERRGYGERSREDSFGGRRERRPFGDRRPFGERRERQFGERREFNSDERGERSFKPRNEFRRSTEGHARPSGHFGFKKNKFSKSFAKRTPKRY